MRKNIFKPIFILDLIDKKGSLNKQIFNIIY